MTPELRLRARYARTSAIQTQSLGETPAMRGNFSAGAFAANETRAPTIIHDLAMQRARAALADLQHTRRDILTLRETIAMGGVR